MNKGIDEPIRIAHVIGKMVGGGVESIVMNYYENIDRSKVQYDFYIDSDSTIIPKKITELGGRIFLIPPYQYQISYQKQLIRLFKENKYKIVYSHLNAISIFPLFAAKIAGVPIRIAHNHSTAGKGELKKNILKYILRPFSKVFPNKLCSCSEYAAQWLFGKKVVEEDKVTIWKNAIDIDRFIFRNDIRYKIRKELDIEDKFVVGHVGRFIHQKNHMFIIDIFSEVYNKDRNSVLLLVGTGKLMNDVKKKVASLGLDDNVIFIGNSDSVESLYQAMDVFIFPSFYEGLGMCAVEAQIAGLPVIASREVPIEAKICNNIQYLSLDDSIEVWSSKILEQQTQKIRSNMKKYALNAGYDIKYSAKKMTEWYINLLTEEEL